MRRVTRWTVTIAAVAVTLAAGALGATEWTARKESRRNAAEITGGDPDRGLAAIDARGCGSCHTIPGVRGADARVGPSLEKFGTRAYVGGVLPNAPDNLVRWIHNAPSVDPMTAMPNLNVPEPEARDIAAYLYTLR
ncbi:MAG TPA: hypothetical protein VF796_17900 [Humisphaera sp.]